MSALLFVLTPSAIHTATMPSNTPFKLLASTLFCTLFSTGCASLNGPAQVPATASTATTASTRQYQQKIQISGKISIQYQQADKPQSLPGGFEWEQDAQGIRITLLSQLDQIMARITQNAQGATLELNGKAPRTASDLDQLLQDTLGWSLPVAGLRDWLQGFVAIDGKQLSAVKAEDQTLTTQGWKLRYVSWHEQPNFPKRIDLQRYTEQAGDVSIRIVVNEWK
ncbi:lipoprotein insertase outer membrane protein LolB [Undibacterium sp. TC4M20W]|uniref:lipoprotein insertase outer membrane protein LolB n=1 Tax=Undibacterium sp. TC4M20W TaxID=3413052 RepID=UPI003BF011DD